jgi:hypothetical protein
MMRLGLILEAPLSHGGRLGESGQSKVKLPDDVGQFYLGAWRDF